MRIFYFLCPILLLSCIRSEEIEFDYSHHDSGFHLFTYDQNHRHFHAEFYEAKDEKGQSIENNSKHILCLEKDQTENQLDFNIATHFMLEIDDLQTLKLYDCSTQESYLRNSMVLFTDFPEISVEYRNRPNSNLKSFYIDFAPGSISPDMSYVLQYNSNYSSELEKLVIGNYYSYADLLENQWSVEYNPGNIEETDSLSLNILRLDQHLTQFRHSIQLPDTEDVQDFADIVSLFTLPTKDNLNRLTGVIGSYQSQNFRFDK